MKPFRLATIYIYFAVLIGSALCINAVSCPAQYDPTAYKTAEISAFGGYLNLSPGLGPYRNNGIGAGVDYTRYFHFPIAPSLEARANFADGNAVGEKSYLVGLRGEGVFLHRYHPYVDFLAGKGTIHYDSTYFGNGYIIGDTSAVYDIGGGIHVDVARQFQAKADLQVQRWRPGVDIYHPVVLLFGVTYRIPFKRYNARRSLY